MSRSKENSFFDKIHDSIFLQENFINVNLKTFFYQIHIGSESTDSKFLTFLFDLNEKKTLHKHHSPFVLR